jgi:AraC family transcriptional regulator of adaptative response/methylated-DNA-[protein]-cysteine methyltransferase
MRNDLVDVQNQYNSFNTDFNTIKNQGFNAIQYVQNELNDLKKQWHQSSFQEDFINGKQLSENIFSTSPKEITVVLSGTNFQLKVWEALLETMPSEMITYSDLAAKVGLPKAQRAVGSAVGKNKVAYLIPCHRVIKEDGDIGKYRWGEQKKKNMFVWEKIGKI